jgi:hypothetical protein
MPIPGVQGVSDDQLFTLLNVCLVGWFILGLPKSWRPLQFRAIVLALCGVFGAIYAATLAGAVFGGEIPAGAGFDTLEG